MAKLFGPLVTVFRKVFSYFAPGDAPRPPVNVKEWTS